MKSCGNRRFQYGSRIHEDFLLHVEDVESFQRNKQFAYIGVIKLLFGKDGWHFQKQMVFTKITQYFLKSRKLFISVLQCYLQDIIKVRGVHFAAIRWKVSRKHDSGTIRMIPCSHAGLVPSMFYTDYISQKNIQLKLLIPFHGNVI